MARADSSGTERVGHPLLKRLLLLAGTLLIVFWPGAEFFASFFQGYRSFHAAFADAETRGFLALRLVVIHIFQLPLVCSLGVFWHGVLRRRVGFARVGYGMLITEMAIISHMACHGSGREWNPAVFYAVSLLLLSPGLKKDSWSPDEGKPGL